MFQRQRNRPQLPRILYVGDVPVERSYHGSALLYRLLEPHASRLAIVETGSASSSARRFENVNYSLSQLGNGRWLNTRFHPYVAAYHSFAATRHEQLNRIVENVECDCILTVAHGFGWLAASALAEQRRVPLHLIVHDDWPRVARVPRLFRPWLDRRFGEVYRQAQSRLCVSPAMRDAYEKRYEGAAEVLYPIRSQTCTELTALTGRRRSNDQTFTIAFAG
ncbi:MAG TPA: glycosyltransferase family 4 protein, partial [Pyrinomonadaceae bacterium]